MSFFEELKRRNVFRVAAAYIVASWLLIQVAETIFPLFGFDERPARITVIALFIFFVPAVIFAWAFELTPEGLKRDHEIDRSHSITPQTGKKLDRIIIVVLALAVGYFAFDKFVLSESRETSIAEVAHQEGRSEAFVESYGDRSIAVLPFLNMSSDSEQEYFSDGITEELLSLLAKIPELRVTSRSSAFSFKGQNLELRAIADRLNVAYILEGSVRKAGNKVRITAQLIEARSDTQKWAETYDRNLDNIFVIQNEIATAVVDALKIKLLGRLTIQHETSPEVYSLYLQGNYFNNLRDNESLDKAQSAFEQALAIDSDYAPAWVGISRTYQHQTRAMLRPTTDGAALAKVAVERALEIDENFAVAWATAAYLKRTYDWDWAGAQAAIDKALQLEPNNIKVLGSAASLSITFGDDQKAIQLFNRIIEKDPLDLSTLRALGSSYSRVGLQDEALDIYRRISALSPEYPGLHSDLGRVFLRQGNPDRALEEFEKESDQLRKTFNKSIAYFSLGDEEKSLAYLEEYIDKFGDEYPLPAAFMYAWRGEDDLAFEWLDKSYRVRTQFLPYILGSPFARSLYGDPRFSAFLEKLGLLDYWKGAQEK